VGGHNRKGGQVSGETTWNEDEAPKAKKQDKFFGGLADLNLGSRACITLPNPSLGTQ